MTPDDQDDQGAFVMPIRIHAAPGYDKAIYPGSLAWAALQDALENEVVPQMLLVMHGRKRSGSVKIFIHDATVTGAPAQLD